MELAGKLMEKFLKPRYEENAVDRLNFRYTSWLMLFSSVALFAPGFTFQPIQCWTPKEFPGGWTEYVHDYCWIENTYFVPFDRQLPEQIAERDRLELNYYQWVPFVLALMALFFNIAHLFWRSLNYLSGIHVRAIISVASESIGRNVPITEVDSSLALAAQYIHSGLRIYKTVSRHSNPLAWFYRQVFISHKSYVTICYMTMKALNILNIIGQFYLLAAFLGPSYDFWGLRILLDIVEARTWFQTGHFPRVTMCDLEIKTLGNTHRWTVQCVLMVNMLNEKFFLFIWWWLLLLFIVTVADFFFWLFNIAFKTARITYIKSLLAAQLDNKGLVKDRHDEIEEFVIDYLKADGFTIIRLIQANSGDLLTSIIVAKLFALYQQEAKKEIENKFKYTSSPKSAEVEKFLLS